MWLRFVHEFREQNPIRNGRLRNVSNSGGVNRFATSILTFFQESSDLSQLQAGDCDSVSAESLEIDRFMRLIKKKDLRRKLLFALPEDFNTVHVGYVVEACVD